MQLWGTGKLSLANQKAADNSPVTTKEPEKIIANDDLLPSHARWGKSRWWSKKDSCGLWYCENSVVGEIVCAKDGRCLET